MKKTKKIIGEIERENLGLKSSHQHPLHPVCNNQLCVFNPQICLFYLFVCFHLFLLVGGYLLYNIVVVFAIHWYMADMYSHGCTCVPHPELPSHLPPHPIPLGLPSAPGLSTCLMHPTWAGDLFHLWLTDFFPHVFTTFLLKSNPSACLHCVTGRAS